MTSVAVAILLFNMYTGDFLLRFVLAFCENLVQVSLGVFSLLGGSFQGFFGLSSVLFLTSARQLKRLNSHRNGPIPLVWLHKTSVEGHP